MLKKALVNLAAVIFVPATLLLSLIMFAGTFDRIHERLDRWNKLPHDKLTTVYSQDWQAAEYQTCFSFNQNNQEQLPELDCMTGKPAKVFMVRFWGRTFAPERSNQVYYTWKCRRNWESDPAITCEYRSESD